MTLGLAPVSRDHLDAAAALLAARQRAHRAAEPRLPARFDEPAACRPLVEESLAMAGASGVVALRGGRVAGYLIGRPWLAQPFLGYRTGWVDYAGAAVEAEGAADIYRALYAAFAPRWLAEGCFAHVVTVPAHDAAALAAWRSLGFGREHTRGLRDAGPVAAARPLEGEVHRAGEEDLAPVMKLRDGLSLYHTGAPIFAPYLWNEEDLRGLTREQLADPRTFVLLAVRGRETLGGMIFSEPPPRAAMVSPDRCIHLNEAYIAPAERRGGAGSFLLDAALAWLRNDGYEYCTVSWESTNLQGARFWEETNGFRPLFHRLVRALDPRIAWARA
jgi:ribosomal protein S18 acetylase RimI-like enzyme